MFSLAFAAVEPVAKWILSRAFVYHRCKGGYIVDGFSRSNSTFCNRNNAARCISNIFLMLIPERWVDWSNFSFDTRFFQISVRILHVNRFFWLITLL